MRPLSVVLPLFLGTFACSQKPVAPQPTPLGPTSFLVNTPPGQDDLVATSLNSSANAIGTTTVETSISTASTDSRSFTENERVITTDGQVDDVQTRFSANVAVGVPYTIDGLIGQINGRPIYADEFLLPISDRIIRMSVELPRETAVAQANALTTSRFRVFINNELISAEAESMLSPEMQQGLFGWLRSMQEETIAQRGGNRALAEASIEDEFQMSMDEFLEQRRTVALASDLLRKRVTPRTIISWRDIEQAYRNRWDEFNPPASLRIGRLRFNTTRDAERIAEVKKLIADGKSFAEMCSQLEIPDQGFWLEVLLPKEGIMETSLVSTIKSRLENLPIGATSDSLDQGAYISWFSPLQIVQAEGMSIYDPEVQISLEAQLSDIRFRTEQNRYLSSLRNRWISEDINKMLIRLRKIAFNRYLPD